MQKSVESISIFSKTKETVIEIINTKYTSEIEASMKMFFETLSEKDRRRYAAVEALKLGNGGQQYICGVLGCDPGTVKRGTEELMGGITPEESVRKPGGGKKKL